MSPGLVAEHVTKRFWFQGDWVDAVHDVSVELEPKAITGVIGESGSGKTTLLRCLMRLEHPDSGVVRYDGQDIHTFKGARLREYRRAVQMVFQDPSASLNPRMTVEQLLVEGMVVHGLRSARGSARRDRAAELLELVGLSAADLDRRPRSFSGGQRQRIAIARALAVEPHVLVCDEPVSALDVSVQAQITNLLMDLTQDIGITMLFVAHDLAVVEHMCNRVYVMMSGSVVESGECASVFTTPAHEYTRSLLAAVPVPDPAVRVRQPAW